ncbi:response regulator [Micavibrio aeruginosavorus]|uniref:Response regulator n=1 Tax=Micavibrio aeruginosavorus (strain ARL-13) TaxID=856793 RepID=G2KSJ2_MICAA|nr:response regulator [Micavibrio aeruginosavorus]AEP09276.1 response regulator [Micavibrio aeruginosavorus ARL-13]
MSADMQIADKLATRPHILVVDDDDRIRQLVTRFLHENGFVVASAESAGAARELLAHLDFDAMVVDIMMPGETGLELTKSIRAHNDIPVLMLTALGEADDRIAGLETGADDYLPKPFEPRELVLRLNAILRRRPKPVADMRVRLGRWVYDPAVNILQNDSDIQALTTVETTLLKALISRAGEAISREDLARMCNLDDSGERTIDVQVTRLRRKIEQDTRTPLVLQTVRGKGYMLRVDPV